MEEINIGDIIEPNTPARRKLFGKGVIVATKQPQRKPVTAVFPVEDGTFVIRDFLEDHVNMVECTDEERQQIDDAAYNYKQLMGELRGA